MTPFRSLQPVVLLPRNTDTAFGHRHRGVQVAGKRLVLPVHPTLSEQRVDALQEGPGQHPLLLCWSDCKNCAVMVLTKKRFSPKHTTHYSADRLSNTQSIFQAEANSQVSTDLSVSIQLWLRKRGREVQHPITDLQRKQLQECFELIDTDGSGSLDAKELCEVFEVRQVARMIGLERADVSAFDSLCIF